MKRSWLLALLLAGSLVTLNSPVFADEASTDAQEDVNSAIGALTKQVNDLASKGPSVEVHGFAQADYISDSTQSLSETVGDGSIAIQGKTYNYAGSNGMTQFSLRNSRISLLAKESMSDWNFKGYIETDFLGINNGSTVGDNEYKFYTQPTLRLRHAYVEADQNDGWQIMAGQWWSMFGWNMDYVLATVAEAPVMGTLYERIPQFRIQYTMGDAKSAQVQLGIGAEKPDQDISQVPTQVAGIRFLMNDMKGYFCSSTGADKLMPFSIGISGRNALYVWGDGLQTNPDVLDQSIWASAIAGDVMIPVLPAAEGKDDPSIVLTGEYTYGAGDTLPFNGGGFGGATAIGAFVKPAPTYGALGTGQSETDNGAVAAVNGGLTPLQLSSWNGQIQITLPKSVGTILTAGYGEVFLMNASAAQLGGTFAPAGTGYNDDSNYFVNVMQDLSKSTRVALEYSSFMTHYVNGTQGTDNRLQLSTWYRF